MLVIFFKHLDEMSLVPEAGGLKASDCHRSDWILEQ